MGALAIDAHAIKGNEMTTCGDYSLEDDDECGGLGESNDHARVQ